MTKQPPMLEERIDVALQPDAAVTSADLAALIEEAETEIAKADQLWTGRSDIVTRSGGRAPADNRCDPRRGSTTAVAAKIAGPL